LSRRGKGEIKNQRSNLKDTDKKLKMWEKRKGEWIPAYAGMTLSLGRDRDCHVLVRQAHHERSQ
jgi:hypothetical protein